MSRRGGLDLRWYQLAGLLWWLLVPAAVVDPGLCGAFLVAALIVGSIVASLAGTGYGMWSAREAGKDQARAAKDEARYRAQQAENAAEQERLNRIARDRDERQAVTRRRARIEASYAKAGVLLTGTPSDYLAEQAATDELNIQRGRQGSEQRQASLLHQGQVALVQGGNLAGAYKSAAQQQMIGTGLQGAGSLLSMGAQVRRPKGAGGGVTSVPIAQPGAVLASSEPAFGSLAGPSWAWGSGSDYWFDIKTGF